MAPASGSTAGAAETRSRQLLELLLSFPAAAVCGVRWKVLARKYHELHGESVDLGQSEHSSPVDAIVSLFQPDTLWVVDAEDSSNPSLGIQDGVALDAHPGLLGCWPSLYRALCKIVLEHGTAESDQADMEGDKSNQVVASMLLAQLRPALRTHWHAKFDEGAMGFRDEDGTFKRMKKLRHMLQVIFKWREARQLWRQSCGLARSELDDAIAPELEIVPSQRHKDLLLRCTTHIDLEREAEPVKDGASLLSTSEEIPVEVDVSPKSAESSVDCIPSMPSAVLELQLEVERLRAENRKLRARNTFLEEQCTFSIPEDMRCTLAIPESGMSPPSSPGRRVLPAETFDFDDDTGFLDDPYEPPPQKCCFKQDRAPSRQSRLSSSDFGGSTDFGGSMWPANFSDRPSACTSANISGSTTPAKRSPFARPGCTYVPMWFPFMNAGAQSGFDVAIIPSGIVRNVCAQLES